MRTTIIVSKPCWTSLSLRKPMVKVGAIGFVGKNVRNIGDKTDKTDKANKT